VMNSNCGIVRAGESPLDRHVDVAIKHRRHRCTASKLPHGTLARMGSRECTPAMHYRPIKGRPVHGEPAVSRKTFSRQHAASALGVGRRAPVPFGTASRSPPSSAHRGMKSSFYAAHSDQLPSAPGAARFALPEPMIEDAIRSAECQQPIVWSGRLRRVRLDACPPVTSHPFHRFTCVSTASERAIVLARGAT
jgi:hypothetical protein